MSNPSPFGAFIGGLAEETLSRRHADELEAKQQEHDQRETSLKFLTSMIDKVTPESRDQLMQQIGNVMNIKGKHRTVWDRLSGSGMDWDRHAVENATQQTLGNIIGPDKAKAAQAPIMIEAAMEGGPNPAYRGQTLNQAAGLGNKLILRDPYQEKIDQLETQYGMQNANREYLQGERFRMTEENKAAEQQRADSYKQKEIELTAKLRAEHNVRSMAMTVTGMTDPPKEILDIVRKDMTDNMGLKEDLLRAKIKQSIAAARSSNAIADNMVNGMKPGEARRLKKSEYDDASKHITNWSQAKLAHEQYKADIEPLKAEMLQYAQQYGINFNTETGDFYSSDPKKADVVRDASNPKGYGNIADRLKLYKAKIDAGRKALGTISSESQILEGDMYSPYVQKDTQEGINRNYKLNNQAALGTLDDNGVDLSNPPPPIAQGTGRGPLAPGLSPSDRQSQINANNTGAAIAAAGGVQNSPIPVVDLNKTFYANVSGVYPIGHIITDSTGKLSGTGTPGSYVVMSIEKPLVPGKSRYKFKRIR